MSVSFMISKDNELLKKYFRIRYERYAEEMGAEPLNDSHFETDEYDLHSHFIIILKDGEVIGGCRLVDKRKTRLPVEEFVFPHLKLPENCVEVSRYALKRDCGLSQSEKIEVQKRCNDFIANLGLQMGFDSFCANIRTLCARWQKRIDPSLKMSVIGSINYHEGAGELIPVLFSR